MKPIGMLERDLRGRGVWMLVDFDGRKLWFFGAKKSYTDLNRAMESVKGRTQEMVDFLIRRAKAEGETT